MAVPTTPNQTAEQRPGMGHGSRGPAFRRGGPGGPRGPRAPQGPRDDFRERVLDMRRVTRVVAGGKRFRFRCTLVIGDEKGRVAIGVAKGLDVQQAVAKAKADAKKHIVMVNLKDGRTIAHEVDAKYSAAKVLIKPASKGHGLRAGGSVRFVLAFAGVKDATAKVLGRTPNKLTNAKATLEALKKLKA